MSWGTPEGSSRWWGLHRRRLLKHDERREERAGWCWLEADRKDEAYGGSPYLRTSEHHKPRQMKFRRGEVPQGKPREEKQPAVGRVCLTTSG